MNSEENSATSRKANQLLPEDLRKLQKLSDYVDEKKDCILKLSFDFTNMWYLRLLWDSKVPDRDFWFFHWFSLTASNRDHVLKEIKKYQKFYEELEKVVHKVKNPQNQTDAEREDPQSTIIRELQKKLSEMYEAAELGKETTSSSAIYHLHKSFIEKHEALEDMITGVENVVLKAGYKEAKIAWKESIQRINDLESKFYHAITKLEDSARRNDEMRENFKNLMSLHAKVMEDQKKMLDENEKLVEDQRALKLKCQKMQEEIENLQKKNKESKEE